MLASIPWRLSLGCGTALALAAGCGAPQNEDLFGSAATGAAPSSGGAATGGIDGTGGPGPATGGLATGGAATGGASTGGTSTGGGTTGGVTTGGAATGGASTGGVSTGGAATGGNGGCTSNTDCAVDTLCVDSSAGICAAVGCSSDTNCAPYVGVCDTSRGLCVPSTGTGGTGGVGTGGVATGGDGTGGIGTGGVGTGGDLTGGTGGGGACSAGTFTPCTSIPRFDGTQTVDGNDGDVCVLPSFELTFANAGHVRVDHAGSENRPETASVRLGWSEAGMHAFVTVNDPAVVPAGDLDGIWNGDGIEFLFARSASGLSGNPGSDDASHATLSASPSLAAQITTVNATASSAPLATSRYNTTVVPGGYTVELLLPWSGGAPSAGSTIAFDLAINSADSDPAGAPDGRDAQAILHLGTPPGTSTCTEAPEPWCDDRTWCTPTLE